ALRGRHGMVHHMALVSLAAVLYTAKLAFSNCTGRVGMAAYIAYYRVSTDRQGTSGLGLAAQREAVARFLGTDQLVAEYTEIESGKHHRNRPQLLAALAECRTRQAVLLIARLDRLARNVAFIANLMESGVDFVAVDMPQATRLTIHILAAVA